MNRERLTILRDHLASLPERDFAMGSWPCDPTECGTPACIGGWCDRLFGNNSWATEEAGQNLGLGSAQHDALFFPPGDLDTFTRQDAIAAIQSMLDSPDDDALPVWPEASQ